jgi:hypothetical protein
MLKNVLPKIVPFEIILKKKSVWPDRPQMAVQCGLCAVHAERLRQEYKHIHSEYVILVFAGQKWLSERASTYIALYRYCYVSSMTIVFLQNTLALVGYVIVWDLTFKIM